MLVSRVVFGFNRQGQSFDRAHVQPGNGLHVPPLVLQPRQIKLVRTVYQIDDRQQRNRAAPLHLSGKETDNPRQRSAYQIERKRPEITGMPGLAEWLPVGKRYGLRDRYGV